MSILKSLESLDGRFPIYIKDLLVPISIFQFFISLEFVLLGFTFAVKAINQVPQDLLFEMVNIFNTLMSGAKYL